MSLNAVDVIFLPALGGGGATGGPATAPSTKRMFLLLKDDADRLDSSLNLTLTDLRSVWEGKLEKFFRELKPDEGETIASKLREEISAANSTSTMFQLAPAGHKSSSATQATSTGTHGDRNNDLDDDGLQWTLQIKTKDESAFCRLANFSMRMAMSSETASSSVPDVFRSAMAEFLSKAVEERKELEQQLVLMDQEKQGLMHTNQVYCEQLISKAADKEQASLDLMKRFLPILNSKKDKIRELQERIRVLESGEDVNDEKIVRSGDEAEDDDDADSTSSNSDDEERPGKTRKPRKKGNDNKPQQHQNIKAAPARKKKTEVQPEKANVKTSSKSQKTDPQPSVEMAAGGDKPRTRGALRREASLHGSEHGSDNLPKESTSQPPSKPSSKDTTMTARTAEDDEGPLPPGWEITVSRSQPGKKCYLNREKKIKTFVRPVFEPVADAKPHQKQDPDSDDDEESARIKRLKQFL